MLFTDRIAICFQKNTGTTWSVYIYDNIYIDSIYILVYIWSATLRPHTDRATLRVKKDESKMTEADDKTERIRQIEFERTKRKRQTKREQEDV